MIEAEPFMALVIYPTTADAQTRQADNFIKLVAEQVRSLPGFRGARLFLSEDGKTLVTLTEWRDRESFQKFRPRGDGAGVGAPSHLLLAAPARRGRGALNAVEAP